MYRAVTAEVSACRQPGVELYYGADVGGSRDDAPFNASKVLWRPRPSAGTARPCRLNVFPLFHSCLYFTRWYRMAVRDVDHGNAGRSDLPRHCRRDGRAVAAAAGVTLATALLASTRDAKRAFEPSLPR